MRAEKRSRKHGWLMRFGFTHVEIGEVLLVYHDEVAEQILPGPGYYHSFRGLSRRFGPRVSVALRTAVAENIEVRTSDELKVSLNVQVRYFFKPQACANQFLLHKLTKLSAFQLTELMKKHIAEATRDVCGEYHEAYLANGANWPRITRLIRHELLQRCTPLGIELSKNAAVAITHLAVPPEIDKVREEVRRRANYAHDLTNMPTVLIQLLHQLELARNVRNGFITLPAPPVYSGGDAAIPPWSNGPSGFHIPLNMTYGDDNYSAKPDQGAEA